MRSRKAFINMMLSLTLQLVITACGLILPRQFISAYGSDVNGIVSSITQFLNYIILFEAGVSNVVRTALFKPLAEKNTEKISSILKATDNFFRKIAFIFIAYSLAVAVIFPFISDSNSDFLFDFTLVLIIAISSFMQYFFGLSCQALIHADQKRYIYSAILIFTTILNTVIAVILIKLGFSVHTVKFATTVIFTLRPLMLRLYVSRHYSPNKHAIPDNDALSSKWDGFAHHTAFFLHSNTDIAVLTIASAFSSKLNIADVSVYTVYNSIVAGMKNLVHSLSSGIESAFGNMIAKGETDTLKKNFRIYEFFSFTVTTVMFTCVGLLILPFISVYTKGVTDASYLRPAFALLLTLSEAVYCLRIPYVNVTYAAGHYKQTRNKAFLEAGINIVLSVILVIPFGLSGVAAATLIAMIFRSIGFAVYLSKNVLNIKITAFFGRVFVSVLCVALSVLFVKTFLSSPVSLTYLSWLVYALEVFASVAVITITVNIIIYKKDFINLLKTAKNIFRKQKDRH